MKTDKLKICMIVHAYYLKDARVRRYSELLITKGYDVDVICLRESNEPYYEKYDDVNIYRIKMSRYRGSKVKYILEYLSSFVFIFIKLNKLFYSGQRYKIIHVHNFPNFLVFTTIVQRFYKVKIILDIHDPMPELFQSKYKINQTNSLIHLLLLEELISIRYANLIITANHLFKNIVTQRSCYFKNIIVILNSPADYFYNNNILSNNNAVNIKNKKDFTLLYIGTLAERYGIETILKVVSEIKKEQSIPNIKIMIIPKIQNEGNYVKKILSDVHFLGLEDCFKIMDPVPHHLMPSIIKQADLSFYTPAPDTHMDIALSLKIPEVISIGIPLVTTRLSVLLRYFSEDSLFMFEAGDVGACKRKIIEIYQSPDMAAKYVKRAQQLLDKISWQKQSINYLSEINNLLN
jgi:glycosyltransferase involved in cell wall biosynthesis